MSSYKQQYLNYLNYFTDDPDGKTSEYTNLLINAVKSDNLSFVYKTIDDIELLLSKNVDVLNMGSNAVYYNKLKRYVREYKWSKI